MYQQSINPIILNFLFFNEERTSSKSCQLFPSPFESISTDEELYSPRYQWYSLVLDDIVLHECHIFQNSSTTGSPIKLSQIQFIVSKEPVQIKEYLSQFEHFKSHLVLSEFLSIRNHLRPTLTPDYAPTIKLNKTYFKYKAPWIRDSDEDLASKVLSLPGCYQSVDIPFLDTFSIQSIKIWICDLLSPKYIQLKYSISDPEQSDIVQFYEIPPIRGHYDLISLSDGNIIENAIGCEITCLSSFLETPFCWFETIKVYIQEKREDIVEEFEMGQAQGLYDEVSEDDEEVMTTDLDDTSIDPVQCDNRTQEASTGHIIVGKLVDSVDWHGYFDESVIHPDCVNSFIHTYSDEIVSFEAFRFFSMGYYLKFHKLVVPFSRSHDIHSVHIVGMDLPIVLNLLEEEEEEEEERRELCCEHGSQLPSCVFGTLYFISAQEESLKRKQEELEHEIERSRQSYHIQRSLFLSDPRIIPINTKQCYLINDYGEFSSLHCEEFHSFLNNVSPITFHRMSLPFCSPQSISCIHIAVSGEDGMMDQPKDIDIVFHLSSGELVTKYYGIHSSRESLLDWQSLSVKLKDVIRCEVVCRQSWCGSVCCKIHPLRFIRPKELVSDEVFRFDEEEATMKDESIMAELLPRTYNGNYARVQNDKLKEIMGAETMAAKADKERELASSSSSKGIKSISSRLLRLSVPKNGSLALLKSSSSRKKMVDDKPWWETCDEPYPYDTKKKDTEEELQGDGIIDTQGMNCVPIDKYNARGMFVDVYNEQEQGIEGFLDGKNGVIFHKIELPFAQSSHLERIILSSSGGYHDPPRYLRLTFYIRHGSHLSPLSQTEERTLSEVSRMFYIPEVINEYAYFNLPIDLLDVVGCDITCVSSWLGKEFCNLLDLKFIQKSPPSLHAKSPRKEEFIHSFHPRNTPTLGSIDNGSSHPQNKDHQQEEKKEKTEKIHSHSSSPCILFDRQSISKELHQKKSLSMLLDDIKSESVDSTPASCVYSGSSTRSSVSCVDSVDCDSVIPIIPAKMLSSQEFSSLKSHFILPDVEHANIETIGHISRTDFLQRFLLVQSSRINFLKLSIPFAFPCSISSVVVGIVEDECKLASDSDQSVVHPRSLRFSFIHKDGSVSQHTFSFA
ncbi:hypothetical protein ADUPG1_009890, partial [Aduncisulcus paluster]